jgi:SAM-dependent methyltransferase
MNLEALAESLACPDCQQPCRLVDAGVTCTGCGRSFAMADGILDMRGAAPPPTPAFHRDPVWTASRVHLDRIQSVYYESGGVVSYIHNVYHHQIAAWNRTRDGLCVDLGCGIGTHFKRYTDLDRFVGLDGHRANLERCRTAFPSVPLIHADLARLPFRTGAVPTVLALAVLEHVYYLPTVLDEIMRIMAPAAALFVTIPTEGGLMWNGGRRLLVGRNSWALQLDYARLIRMEHCNDAADITKKLLLNFEVERQTYWPLRFPSIALNLLMNFQLRTRG